jgi:hypothetical protein
MYTGARQDQGTNGVGWRTFGQVITWQIVRSMASEHIWDIQAKEFRALGMTTMNV